MWTDRAFAAAALLAASHASAADWNVPGRDPYTGSRFAAVMGYSEIPLASRVVLVMKVIFSQPDVVTVITRTGISPVDDHWFTDDVRGMHFGRGRQIDMPDRGQWSDTHYELTRMWCHGVDCIGSPYVCNNIFRTTRAPVVRGVPEEAQRATEVPEPSSLWLVLACGVALAAVRSAAAKAATPAVG